VLDGIVGLEAANHEHPVSIRRALTPALSLSQWERELINQLLDMPRSAGYSGLIK
jgi:hypothetical protein